MNIPASSVDIQRYRYVTGKWPEQWTGQRRGNVGTRAVTSGRGAARPSPLPAAHEAGTPRSRRAAATKERIVRAAASAFDRRGYLGVNLNDVVVELGLTKGALYYFFPAKEDLAVEIVRRHVAAAEALAEDTAAGVDNRLDALIDITRRMARRYQTDPIAGAGSRLSTERALISADLPPPFVGWTDRMTRMIRAGKARGEVGAHIRPKATAEVLVAFLHGAQTMSADLNERRDLPARVEQFWELILPVLRP